MLTFVFDDQSLPRSQQLRLCIQVFKVLIERVDGVSLCVYNVNMSVASLYVCVYVCMYVLSVCL